MNLTKINNKSNQSVDLGLLVASNLSFYYALTLVGIIANGLSVAVLRCGHLKDICFKYFLAISTADLAYLFIFNIDALLKIFQLQNTYVEQCFQLIFINYLSSGLALFVILLDLINSFTRYLVCLNVFVFQNVNCRNLLAALFSISLLLHVPELLARSIHSNSTSLNRFVLEKNAFGYSRVFKITKMTVWTMRMFLLPILLIVINILSGFALFKRIAFKPRQKINALKYLDAETRQIFNEKLRSDLRIKQNITLLVFCVSNLNIINSILFTYGLYLSFNDSDLTLYFKVCFFYMIGMRGLNFFIYFAFNNMFRKTFFEYIYRKLNIMSTRKTSEIIYL